MNSTAVVSFLAIILVIESLKCNATKTKLIITMLKIRTEDKAASVGIDLAIEAAKNSSDLKAFFDKYELVIDDNIPGTKVRFFHMKTFLNTYRLFTTPKVNMAQLDICQVLLLSV